MLALLHGMIKSTVCWAGSRHTDDYSPTATSKFTGLHFSQKLLCTAFSKTRITPGKVEIDGKALWIMAGQTVIYRVHKTIGR